MRDERCIRIFKYRSLSGKYGREAIKRALSQNELYWQSPVQFNDPFDCMPILYFGDNAAERQKFRVRASNHVYRDLPRASRRQNRRNIAAMPMPELELHFRNGWSEWLSASAVNCFSEVHDHPLMWGHYADSHKGICLIFNEIVDDETEWFAFPVSYQKARPRVNLTRFYDPAVMMQALFLKSDHWSYEREQRMVDWHRAPGYRQFPARQLKGIILGAKIAEDDEQFVRMLLKKRSELEVYRAEIDATEFRLNIIPA